MKDAMTKIVFAIVFVGIIGGLVFGGYFLKRWFNYRVSYQGMVQEQVEKALNDHIQRYHK